MIRFTAEGGPLLRALLFLLQVVVIVLAAVWLIERPGDMSLEAFGYSVQMRAGLFLIVFIVLALIAGVVFRALAALVSLPGWLGAWGRRRRKARAMRQLTQSYALLAAGQADKALKLAHRIQTILPEARALALLAEAQAHRMLGHDASAAMAYQTLMKDKDAAFLGLKGLMGHSIEHGRTQQALDYTRQAVKLHPKAGWVIKTLYDLQITARDFDAAHATLKKAVKVGTVEKEQAQSDEIAMLMYQAERAEEEGRNEDGIRFVERALKLNPAFIPAVAIIAQDAIGRGKTRRAQAAIELAWKTSPHPLLVPLWSKLAPANTSRDMTKRMRWYEILVTINPASALSHITAAEEALALDLIGEARGHLQQAEKIAPSAMLYRLMLKVERQAGADNHVIRALEDKLEMAPPSPVWHCRKTGIIYESWSPIARPHGTFNTILWGVPQACRETPGHQHLSRLDDPLMIGAL